MARNKETGLIEGMVYERKENGRIDWKKMIPEKFLYLNPAQKAQLEKKYGKRYEEIPIAGAEDKELVILLAGIRYILDLYGYLYVKTEIVAANPEYAAAHCEIKFISNSEESMEQIFTENASATLESTKGFGQKYLVEMASNRAMARCVRAYLQISVVSKEELAEGFSEDTGVPSNKPLSLLKDLMERKGISFIYIKNKCTQAVNKYEGADSWQKIEDIPAKYCMGLIETLQKIKDKD